MYCVPKLPENGLQTKPLNSCINNRLAGWLEQFPAQTITVDAQTGGCVVGEAVLVEGMRSSKAGFHTYPAYSCRMKR